MSATLERGVGDVAPATIRVRQSKNRHALPGVLPPGERMLWQGAPDWRAVARHALHLRALAAYLGVLIVWVGVSAVLKGGSAGDVAFQTGRAALAAAVPLAVFVAYAWFASRNAAYTITNKRVVMRMGLVLPLTLNLPYSRIDGAGLSTKSDGTGDIVLKLAPASKGLGWFIMWPHTRPWRMAVAEPMLRGLHDAPAAAQILARALAESAESPVPASVPLV
jgi:hypothetical protein